jgi:anti-anti-sigma factor
VEIETYEIQGAFVLKTRGDVDLYASPTLHHAYAALAEKSSRAPIVIDLADTSYLDSSGIGVLVQIRADANARGVGFRLCGVRGMVEKLLTLSRMKAILPISSDATTAIEAIRSE